MTKKNRQYNDTKTDNTMIKKPDNTMIKKDRQYNDKKKQTGKFLLCEQTYLLGRFHQKPLQ